jgi:hydrogenase-4 component B
MAVTSYLLIAQRSDTPDGQEGAWRYLVATQLGTAFLLAMLPLLANPGELRIDRPLDFDGARLGSLGASRADLLFVLAPIGFGTRAALALFHSWVPRAYRTAPTWVAGISSALIAEVSLWGWPARCAASWSTLNTTFLRDRNAR